MDMSSIALLASQEMSAKVTGSGVVMLDAAEVLAGDFGPGFRIELRIKDMTNPLETAHKRGVARPLSSQLMEIMLASKVDGKANKDHCGIGQFYDPPAKVQVRK